MNRANAAQMAARNVKKAKAPSRAGLKPVQGSPAPSSQPMSFGGQAGGQGGLFGGSISAPGSFEFSAPASGLSFPPSAPTPASASTSFGGFGFDGGNENRFGHTPNDLNDNPSGIGGDEDRRKKSFQGTPQAATSTSSNMFGQKQQSQPTADQLNTPFSFTPQATQQTVFGGFNSSAQKPAANMFSIKGSASQPTAPGPSSVFSPAPTQQTTGKFSFGQTSTSSAQQPASNFSFNTPAPQATPAKPANSNFSFLNNTPTPSATQQPSTGGFQFTQNKSSAATSTQGQPASGGSFFSQNNTSAAPSAQGQPVFGGLNFSQPTTSTAPHFPASPSLGNIFQKSQNTEVVNSQASPTKPTFSFGTTSEVEKAPTNPFGISQPQSPQVAPMDNPFASLLPSGTQAQQSSTGSNVFANITQNTASSKLFGEPRTTASSSSSSGDGGLFDRVTKPEGWTSGSQPTALATDMFSKQTPASTGSLSGGTFGGSTSNPFGSLTPAKSSPELNKPTDQTTPGAKVYGFSIKGQGEAALESGTLSSNKASSANLVGSSPSSVSIAPSVQLSSPNPFSQSSMPAAEIAKTGSDAPLSSGSSTAQTTGKAPISSFGSSQPTSSVKTNGFSLSSPLKTMGAPSAADQTPASSMFSSSTSRKSNDATKKGSNGLVNGHAADDVDFDTLYAKLDAASSLSDEELSPLAPSGFSDDQRVEFFTAYRLRSLNKAVEEAFGCVTINMGIGKLISYYNEKKVKILDRSSLPYPGSKRSKPSHDEEREVESPSKRSRQETPKILGPSSLQDTFQITPGLMRNKPSNDESLLDESSSKRSRQSAPPKPNPFQSQASSETPHRELFANAGSTASNSFSSSPSKGKRKADDEMTKQNEEEKERQGKRFGGLSSVNGNSGGSSTSNLFKDIVDTPSPSRKIATPKVATRQSTVDETSKTPAANPFASLPIPAAKPFSSLNAPKSPIKSTGSGTTTNLTAEASTSSSGNKLFSSMPGYDTKFSLSKSTSAQPPKFTLNASSALDEFKKESEKKRMEAAMLEDKDSSEDEDEWKANYAAKEEQRKKEFAELSSKSKGFSFKPTPASSPSSQSGSLPDSLAPTTNDPRPAAESMIFGQPMPSAGNSAAGSRGSTPGAFGSSTGSVFDGQGSYRPAITTFSIPETASGSSSGQADDDSSTDGEENDNSENKDPNYDPVEDSGSGPGTPVGETGAGIASAKKSAAPVSFGSSEADSGSKTGTSSLGAGGLFGRISKPEGWTSGNPSGVGGISGTSSLGGSLFGRVTKPSPSEDQENTPPATTNIFGSVSNGSLAATNNSGLFSGLNRPTSTAQNTTNLFGTSTNSPAPANNTWNPNSPIFFGNTTPTSSAINPPTVSITSASPNAPTSSLFGTPIQSSSGTGLFGSPSGSTNGSAPALGFNFGAQPGGASSLFPSAVASTTTSRATSPGNTTDDNAAEDVGAEKHAQIDLTTTWPGTEDEDVVFEVKAKATQYIFSEWKIKGVGALRVLKHKQTGAARVLLRTVPGGSTILNKSLLPSNDYKPSAKTVKFMAASDDGGSFETWLLQVKTAESAEELAMSMETSKS